MIYKSELGAEACSSVLDERCERFPEFLYRR